MSQGRMPAIVLVRHGETDWNRLGLLQGRADIPMNERGRAQARELVGALADDQIDLIYSSPLSRARELAELIAEERGLEVEIAPELVELSYGLWQGMGLDACARCNPGLEWRFRHDPWRVRFPGGETLADLRERVRGFLDRIRIEHRGESLLISGHGHLNRVFMIEALNWSEGEFWRIEQENGSYTRLEPEGEGWILH